MEAFNDALLVKQVWRILKESTSFVARVLKVKYCPHANILDANLGHRPSFTRRSLWGAREVARKGSRWLINNGDLVDVWADRWILRPSMFKVISPKPSHIQHLQVRDLIDAELGCWWELVINDILLPCDAEIILGMPLCTSCHRTNWCGIFLLKACSRCGWHTMPSFMKIITKKELP